MRVDSTDGDVHWGVPPLGSGAGFQNPPLDAQLCRGRLGKPSLRLLWRRSTRRATRHGSVPWLTQALVRALLHQDVSRLEMDRGIVEQHSDLARHDDGVPVDGAGAVHGGMARRAARAWGRRHPGCGCMLAGSRFRISAVSGRKIHYAKHAAAARRHDADIDRCAVGRAGEIGGRLARLPIAGVTRSCDCGRTFCCGEWAPSSSTTALVALIDWW